MPALALNLATLPQAVTADRRHLVREPEVPEPILDWFGNVVMTLSSHPDLVSIEDQWVVPDQGPMDRIEVILCHPDDLDEIFGCAGALGVHQIETPVCDPFLDGSPHAKAYRVLIAWDTDVVSSLILDDWHQDGFLDEADAALSWVATVGHELHHVILFAGNGNFHAPQALDDRCNELGHDLFDFSTGYGIRPAIIMGMEMEAEDAEEAHALMEEMVEERAHSMCSPALLPHARELATMLAALRMPVLAL